MKNELSGTVQKGFRLPRKLLADIELIYESSPVRFVTLSDCVRFLLEQAVYQHLPAKVVAERQAEINKKVAEEEELRKYGHQIIKDTMARQERERKKAG